jgi:hypothetical protein
MTRITSATLRDDTIQRLGGNGDNWYATWAADGSLLLAMCDGAGFPGMRRRYYNSRLYRATGHPETGVEFHDDTDYPDLSAPIGSTVSEPMRDDDPDVLQTRYYGFATLSVDGTVYQYLNTWNLPTTPEVMKGDGMLRFIGAKLVYSPDGGTTWHNQDGSTPVHWETWAEQSSDSMVFFHEPGEAFGVHSVLQMGRDYSLNTDGYVYVYSPNGNEEGTMNQLVMFRVPKERVLDRGAYEYFVRRTDGGTDDGAEWSSDIADRGVVHTFPSGWVNRGVHPYAWQPTVTYNPGLGVYILCNWATGPGGDGVWFGRPSYLGLYQSETPWGPWEQFHEDTSWTPGGDAKARCYQPVIAPNWISEDGTSFWMIWTDYQSTHTDMEEQLARREEIKNSDLSDEEKAIELGKQRPYYAFNIQRVDLEVG